MLPNITLDGLLLSQILLDDTAYPLGKIELTWRKNLIKCNDKNFLSVQNVNSKILVYTKITFIF